MASVLDLSYDIEKLDEGAILIAQGKRKAINDLTQAVNTIVAELRKTLVEQLVRKNVSDLHVEIAVDINLPKIR